ncbi:antibiotic biosynthesis monooxygenase [Streptacidiphilus sp. MAP5-3]|jgi:heme-degrading monooxygenase HmoA|uniref:antibiotic biosynthesis monooxygenase family protein n=1 Tax=unclassified Streptacidiphilus TaxID=2643834 RepID=UPI00351377B6
MEARRPARTPEPPYYSVVFTSVRAEGDHGYSEMAKQMAELVTRQPGFLGSDACRGADGLGITVAYFDTEENVKAWRANAEHTMARNLGREKWYSSYAVHVAKVERAYSWERPE